MVGDGQVSIGNMVAKPNAKKIRRIGETVVAGWVSISFPSTYTGVFVLHNMLVLHFSGLRTGWDDMGNTLCGWVNMMEFSCRCALCTQVCRVRS